MSSGGSTAFTYADELALVTHLLEDLEARLGGRRETRILRIVPSDHCHLGVLGPRDPNAADVEAPEEEGDQAEQQEAEAISANVANVEDDDEGETGPAVSDVAQAEQQAAEQSGRSRDSTRRPPSSLGFEIVARPVDGLPHVDVTICGRFYIYTQHFPTFEEQREVLGTTAAVDDQATPQGAQAARPTVTLLEAFERREVVIPPFQLRIPIQTGISRIDDQGRVQAAVDDVLDNAVQEARIWREIDGNAVVPVQALQSEETLATFLGRLATGPIRRPPLHAGVDVRVHRQGDGSVRVRCYLCNYTPRDTIQRFRDQHHILADAHLEGTLTSGELQPVELLPVPRDYQFDLRVWAVGHGASVAVSDDRRAVRTQSLARYQQPRRTTNQEPSATFEELISDPLGKLEEIRQAMAEYAADWQSSIIDANAGQRSASELEQCQVDLDLFRDEEARFAAGIAALAADERLSRAFVAMNRVLMRTSGRRGFDRWHLFQIVFIVTQLPSLAIREEITEGEWPRGERRSWTDALEWADVLWFPTGGGKTEAYLGLISCAALYDRLRGKSFGVTAWLRFPLRMLSVQQLQRAATVLWETEQERRDMLGDHVDESAAISLGYFVGRSSTPNRFNDEWAFDRIENDTKLREKLLLVSTCPACGENSVQIQTDRAAQRIRHVCTQCSAELPIYVSDDEVYRHLPTVIVGTIDKMALIAYNAKLPMLWGGAAWRCQEGSEHGFGLGDWCIQDCPRNPQGGRARARTTVTPYDPTPSFHIQDELHLLQQELGAFAGHYETLVRRCEQELGGRPPKTVAATATIEGFEHQIRHIYGVANARRFPTRGFDLLETFYTAADRDDALATQPVKTARLYVAFRPPHLHAADAASLCARYLHEALIRLYDNPYDAAAWLPNARTEQEVRSLLYYYATTLTYVGSKARGVRIRQALEKEAGRLRPGNARDLTTEFLSGDSSLADIAETVRRLENPPGWTEEAYLDATVATNVISHGVDVERFNVMVMDSIPEETADYIQASSRSGRRHVGIVLAVLPSYSLRASSIYHRFKEYHQHLERLVSPVSVNRFAKYAAERTAPGMMIGLLLGQYGPRARTDGLRRRNLVAELLTPNMSSGLPFQLNRSQFESGVEAAYGLQQGVYPAGLESAMEEVIEEQIERFLFRVRGSQQRDVWDVMQPRPMTSLRDVDVGVRFRPKEDANWYELQWFNSQM